MIFAGGIEEEVFSLSSKGVLLSSFSAGDVVHHIRKGDIAGSGKEYAAVAIASGQPIFYSSIKNINTIRILKLEKMLI